MNTDNKSHIANIKTYLLALAGLLFLTALLVAINSIEIGPIVVFIILLVASVKAFLVLSYFMLLKFNEKLVTIIVGIASIVFMVVLVITFLDYSFR